MALSNEEILEAMSRRPVISATGILLSLFILHFSHFAFAQCAPNTILHPLNNPAPLFDGEFGCSVAVSGNLAVVGARRDESFGVEAAGRAYVFDITTGALVATLNNPTPIASKDFFGASVAISGNLAVVGAFLDDPGEVENAGTVYVFDATTGVLLSTLINPVPEWGDGFGNAVAISGNVVVVGASRDDPGGVSEAGTAYVFNATTGALTATLNNPTPTSSDEFGQSVAVSGNVAVVGANGDDLDEKDRIAASAGTAYVFNATTGALQATLNNPAPRGGDRFGNSVAISGDVVVVGAKEDRPEQVFAGTAYVFNATSGVLTATLNHPQPMMNDNFGVSVAISGNLALVGAHWAPFGEVFATGMAFVFDAATGDLLATLNNPAPGEGDSFGNSVAIFGSIAVVGAGSDDFGGVVRAGSAHIFFCRSPSEGKDLKDNQ